MQSNERFVFNKGVTFEGSQAVDIDQGLRSFMLGIYNHMAAGVALTGAAAFGVSTWAAANPAVAQALYASPLKWLITFAPLIMVFAISFMMNRMSASAAKGWFYAFAVTMGVSISSIFLVYTNTSIFQAFLVSATAFGALSLWGYTTKRDISGWGAFLFMGVIGLVIASIVNIFLGSSALGFAVSVIALFVFAALTAWDTQRLKSMYLYGAHAGDEMSKMAIMGALSLYINLINIFMSVLQLTGERE